MDSDIYCCHLNIQGAAITTKKIQSDGKGRHKGGIGLLNEKFSHVLDERDDVLGVWVNRRFHGDEESRFISVPETFDAFSVLAGKLSVITGRVDVEISLGRSVVNLKPVEVGHGDY